MANSNLDENDLYEILGYSSKVSGMNPIEVYSGRKDFVINSYNANYKKNLMKRFGAMNNSEFIDILHSKGFLGVERKHISTLGEFKNCGVPSKFISQKISHALYLLEAKLNTMTYNGNRLLDYRKNLLLAQPNEVLSVIESYRIDLDQLFLVKFYEENSSVIRDNVLYISEINGYTEKEVRDILFNCYLLGLPRVPLYMRKMFLDSLPGTLSVFGLDSIHTMIDIANIARCSVKELLNSFGFNLPDAEKMFSECFGYFSYYNNRIYYSNRTSEIFYEMSLDEFVSLMDSNSLSGLDINLTLALKDEGMIEGPNSFKPSNVFGS